MKALTLALLVLSTNAFAWGNPNQQTHTLRNTFDPLQSYTIRHQPGGRSTITNTFNPLESYTVTPKPQGGVHIRDTFNPLNSWDLR